MGNIIDYIQWRGDLRFCERSFCDADNLVFSYLAYYDFSGIVSDSDDFVTIREVEERYRELGRETLGISALVLTAMAQSERFRNVRLSHYISKTDPQMQFAALRIELGDGTFYLAFRGTDDSIVGWKEDFSISYQVIPAQLEAVEYLKKNHDAGRMYLSDRRTFQGRKSRLLCFDESAACFAGTHHSCLQQ